MDDNKVVKTERTYASRAIETVLGYNVYACKIYRNCTHAPPITKRETCEYRVLQYRYGRI